MTTIHRTVIPIVDNVVVRLPGYRRAIHAAPSREDCTGIPAGYGVEVWYETDLEDPVDVRFYVHGTGLYFEHPDAQHVATFPTADGALIWHVYAEYPLAEKLT